MFKTARMIMVAGFSVMLFSLVGCQFQDKGNSPRIDVAQKSRWNGNKYDPPITITRVVKHNTSSTKFINGEDWDNNVFTRWLGQTLGMNVKTLWVVNEENDAFAKKLKLSITSGEELPDVITYRGSYETLNQLLDSGRFMAVGDLFEQYASDIWKREAVKYPTMWYSVTRGDQHYGLPLLDYSMNTEPVLWIREDWMEKLGLQAPKTLDDLEHIMDAFTNRDPDGNRFDDTYGLAVTLRAALNTWMSDLSWLFGAYGSIVGQWNMEGSELAYGSIHPSTKQALAKLKEWVDNGYIAKDASTWDEAKGAELFTDGKAGIVAGPHWMPDWPLPNLSANVPDAQYKAYPAPAGPDGYRGVRSGGSAPVNGVVLINKDSKHPEAYFHYYNYLLEHYANPAAGSEFEFGFAEGYDYMFLGGKLIKESDQFVNPMDYSLSYEGARIPDLMIEALSKLATNDPETPFEHQVKAKRKVEEIEAAAIVLDYHRQGIDYPSLFEGEATETMKSKFELLLQMEREAFTKIIYGQLPLDAFDDFVRKWKEAGGDQITREVNDWYQSVQ